MLRKSLRKHTWSRQCGAAFRHTLRFLPLRIASAVPLSAGRGLFSCTLLAVALWPLRAYRERSAGQGSLGAAVDGQVRSEAHASGKKTDTCPACAEFAVPVEAYNAWSVSGICCVITPRTSMSCGRSVSASIEHYQHSISRRHPCLQDAHGLVAGRGMQGMVSWVGVIDPASVYR